MLALLSTTSPSASLREFISTRGPGFILNPGATFSDDVLRSSYSSSYPTTLGLQHGLPNATTFSGAFPNYYNQKITTTGTLEHTATRNTLFVLLILGFSSAIGFMVGAMVMFFQKKHGWISYARIKKRRSASLDEDKAWGLGDAGITSMHTRRDKRRSGQVYTNLRGILSKAL